MEYNGYTIKIEHDDDAVNPRKEYDQFGQITAWGKLQHLSDDRDIPNLYTGAEYKQAQEYNNNLILPLYCYQHSCIILSTTPFSCPWDSGQIGFITMNREVVDREFNGNVELATKHLIGEVEEYSSYVNGDTWGYIIKNDDGDEVESSWGYRGYDYCLDEAKSVVDSLVKQTV